MVDLNKVDEHLGHWYDTIPGGRLLLLGIQVVLFVLMIASLAGYDAWKANRQQQQGRRVNRNKQSAQRIRGRR